MSTVLYDFYKTNFKDFNEVITWSVQAKKDIEGLAKEKFERVLAKLFCDTVLDIKTENRISPMRFSVNNLVYEFDLDKKFLDQFRQKLRKHIPFENLVNVGNDHLDFRAQLVFIPYKNEIYAKWFCEDVMFSRVVEKSDMFEDFSYDNRSDGPEYIDQEEYDKRGVIIDEIFEGNPKICDRGLTIDLFTEVPWRYDKESLDKSIQDQIDNIYDDYIQELCYKSYNGEEFDISDWLATYTKFLKWHKTEEGQILHNRLKSLYRKDFPDKDTILEISKMTVKEAFKKITGVKYESIGGADSQDKQS